MGQKKMLKSGIKTMETLEPFLVSCVFFIYLQPQNLTCIAPYIWYKYMNATLLKILQSSQNLFMRYGIRSVTMNDIARELGISKKTLYQHVDNKADLVHKGISIYFKQEEEMVLQITRANNNAIVQMVQIGRYVYLHLKNINPSVMYDLRKYYRKSFELIETYRKQFMHDCIKNNIELGIAQGWYRPNLCPDLITQFYLAKAEMFANPKPLLNNKRSIADVYMVLFQYHLYGIASRKGIEYLEENLPAGQIPNNDMFV